MNIFYENASLQVLSNMRDGNYIVLEGYFLLRIYICVCIYNTF